MRFVEGASEPSFPALEPGQLQKLGVRIELLHGPAGQELLER
jgi:hypothetical protein